ncbi:hypothetical protein SUGI_0607040 [Cryptomeria japonica]|nr:hypothetical protein SUGI_0607040 [Cryptomeria japonica]
MRSWKDCSGCQSLKAGVRKGLGGWPMSRIRGFALAKIKVLWNSTKRMREKPIQESKGIENSLTKSRKSILYFKNISTSIKNKLAMINIKRILNSSCLQADFPPLFMHSKPIHWVLFNALHHRQFFVKYTKLPKGCWICQFSAAVLDVCMVTQLKRTSSGEGWLLYVLEIPGNCDRKRMVQSPTKKIKDTAK